MTKQELKNIKDAWAKSIGYDNYIDLVSRDFNEYKKREHTDSLLMFSIENSYKFVKRYY